MVAYKQQRLCYLWHRVFPSDGLVVALTLIAIGALGIYESHFAKEEEGHAEEEQAAMQLALAVQLAGVRMANHKPMLQTLTAGLQSDKPKQTAGQTYRRAGGPSAAAAGIRAKSLKASLATYATGIVYGLQPDALFVVIPALALPTKLAAVAYCTTFVVGTVMAMGGYTLLIGTTSAALTKERPWLQAHLSTVASAVAILVGVLIGLAGLGVQVPFFS
ncbi:hypothetical protein QJQ45_000857 [Haematococcus lacustris]|nr:hypothetical protein QJQ45_000857 [Haematococcus lacustris]